MRTKDQMADLTIENSKTMFAAQQQDASTLSGVEAQQRYVDASADRCYRCGTLTFGLFPGAAPYCVDCVTELRELDRAAGEFMWWGEMMQQIRERSQ